MTSTTKTDRKLLELAAKAAGIEIAWPSTGDLSCRRTDTWDIWNPLIDDGDALRLAVKLWLIPNLQEFIERFISEEDFERDRKAATRRAIVRAAAELGKQ